jgi:RNA polymerase sigma-70 factor (ECF subfamily)
MRGDDDGFPSNPGPAETMQSLHRIARRLVSREQDAEDLAQEVWLTVLARPELRAHAGWLRLVARRVLWRLADREQARAQREETAARSGLQEGALDEVEAASLREHLRVRVDSLDEPYRSVVRLHCFEELSIDEIARVFDRPSATVRVQLKRGRDALRERLERTTSGSPAARTGSARRSSR